MIALRRYTVVTFYDTEDDRIEQVAGRCWTWRGAEKLAAELREGHLVRIWDDREQMHYDD